MNGVTLWFTGLPCSGKTTIADKLALILREKGKKVERLDGDIVRKNLTKDLGFSRKDRDENIKRVTFFAKDLTQKGIAVLATFVSPYRERRNKSRKQGLTSKAFLLYFYLFFYLVGSIETRNTKAVMLHKRRL